MGDGGRKRVVLGGNKKKFGQKHGFCFVKMGIFCGQRRKARAKKVFVRKKAALSEVRKVFCKWKTFVLRKRAVFSAHAKPPGTEKHFSAYKNFNFAPHQS